MTSREWYGGVLTRRQMLRQAGTGFGMLGLAALLAQETAASESAANPLAVRLPHHAPRAKRCIFLFMAGGPSQLDLFDPKPRVTRDNGKPLPFEKPSVYKQLSSDPTSANSFASLLFASPWRFQRYGQAGIAVSELLPHLASCADDLCVLRSMVADNLNHTGACLQMNTGAQAFSRPSLGSWLVYGLGSENQNLPGFVVIAPSQPYQGAPLWSSSFLLAAYQGTWVHNLNAPIADARLPFGDRQRQRDQLDVLRKINELHKRERVIDGALDARIASFELAFRMQVEAPAAFSIHDESPATKKLYGVDDRATRTFGQQCLLARRLVERGVRFVQVYDHGNWDHHSGLKQGLASRCAAVDRPIAALLKDLKARGLLDDTLVVWGGEFGRTPTAQGADGRMHHPFGFTMWLAGGGVRGGMVHGATDEYGWHAVEDKVHVHDLHATILHLLGFDHTKLTYRFQGRDHRLTDVYGRVVQRILA
jgi:Protein of unknown function (DUF1501)